MNLTAAANHLGISRETLRKLLDEIPHTFKKGQYVFKEEDLETYRPKLRPPGRPRKDSRT